MILLYLFDLTNPVFVFIEILFLTFSLKLQEISILDNLF